MMLSKLSWKSVRSRYYHYVVYLIGMIFAVAIYYSFNAITYDQVLLNSVGSEVALKAFLSFGALLIAVMILSFMFTINRFFFTRRAKEVGIYQLIGMKKRQIAGLFFSEIYILGLAALVIGIFFGIVFSKLFSMILIKVMVLNVESAVNFSIPSIVDTVLVFLLLLLMVSLHSAYLIYSYRLSGFFKQEERPIIEAKELTIRQAILGVLGILLIIGGYVLSLNVVTFLFDPLLGTIGFLLLPFVLIGLCGAGTYLFFKYTIHIFIHLFIKKKGGYYQGLSMLVAGNTRLHLYKGSNTLTTITIFIACSLGFIGGSATFYTLGIDNVNAMNPTDFIVNRALYESVESSIGLQGALVDSVALQFKSVGSQYHYYVGKEKTTSEDPINLLSLTNYRAYQKINPYLKTVNLSDDEQAILFVQRTQSLLRYDSVFQLVGGATLKATETMADYLGDPLLRYNRPTLVVTDELFDSIDNGVPYSLMAFNVKRSQRSELSEQLSKKFAKEWQFPIYYDIIQSGGEVTGYVSETSKKTGSEAVDTEKEGWTLNYTDRQTDLVYSRKLLGALIYIVLFLGIFALIISGSVLMVRQFAEAERERSTYRLLERLGIPQKQVRRLVYQQNIIIFFLPMLLGIFHAFFAVHLFNQLVPSSGYRLAYISCGLLILIYILYYVLTSRIYCWIVENDELSGGK
ncbi:ABC transporter permease [Enterococcus sp. BWR-S5]|nr:ABC transporter permease [Enterococcus sp. BWR-S5]